MFLKELFYNAFLLWPFRLQILKRSVVFYSELFWDCYTPDKLSSYPIVRSIMLPSGRGIHVPPVVSPPPGEQGADRAIVEDQ